MRRQVHVAILRGESRLDEALPEELARVLLPRHAAGELVEEPFGARQPSRQQLDPRRGVERRANRAGEITSDRDLTRALEQPGLDLELQTFPATEACASFTFCAHSSQHTSTV